MSNTRIEFSDADYRIIALAAVMQCAVNVHQLASRGQLGEPQKKHCIDALMQLSPGHSSEVYPQVMLLSQGLDVLQKSFDAKGLQEYPEAIRYFLGMLVLQQKLLKSAPMQARIRDTLGELSAMREEATAQALSENEFRQLGKLYQDTLSNLTFRIHVAGEPQYLRQQEIANQIRALLLSGIRSAVLWHQLGGRRWQLLFGKKRIREQISSIRRRLVSSNTVDLAEHRRRRDQE